MRGSVAIAGAGGFVGQALCRDLARDHRVIALGRRPGVPDGGVAWRVCDLFALRKLGAALAGADAAVYLVHSMLPSARLSQASFADLDLLLADNFARAAEGAGVRRIVYVGGLAPSGDRLSPHLASRKEVEETLGARGARLAALRCGIIVGPGSASLWILANLVRRLPLMILPRWTESASQPIALADVVRAVRLVLDDPSWVGAFDLGGPDVMSYREMMARTAAFLGLRRRLVGVPLFTPRLSRLWVSVFGSAPRALVEPLVESLRHDLTVAGNPLQQRLLPEAVGYEAALAAALGAHGRPLPPPSSLRLSRDARRRLRAARSVRSVQRLPLPPGRDARWAAEEYLRFLPRFMRPWVRVETDAAGGARFFVAGTRLCLLALQLAPGSRRDRTELEIVGGAMLARGEGPRGRFELREVLGGRALLGAIHDYRPRLPWALYAATQARVHLAVMRGFARHLARLAGGR